MKEVFSICSVKSPKGTHIRNLGHGILYDIPSAVPWSECTTAWRFVPFQRIPFFKACCLSITYSWEHSVPYLTSLVSQ